MSDNYVSTGGAIEVPFSDDETVKDDELILDDEAPSLSPQERLTRKAKKSERIKLILDEGKKSKEEVTKLRGELDQLKAAQAELRGYMQAQNHQKQASEQWKDPYQSRLELIRARQSEAYQAAQNEIKAGTFTAERVAHYEKISHEIEDEKGAVYTERALAQREPQQQQNHARQAWVSKYPEVYSNPNAYQYAESTFNRRKALGEQATHELVDEIMAETMNTFKLGPKRGPTSSEKARMSGIASSGSGGGGSTSGGITMNKDLKKMATALYSNLSEDEAVKKWTNTVGKQLRKDKVL